MTSPVRIIVGTYEGSIITWEAGVTQTAPTSPVIQLTSAFVPHGATIRALALDTRRGLQLLTGSSDDTIKCVTADHHHPTPHSPPAHPITLHYRTSQSIPVGYPA